MPEPICRWGILGAANIARKNWKAICRAGNASLVAVASRARAKQFIDECQSDVPMPIAPIACGYEDLLRRPDVDAVYIPLPTGIRAEWVARAAKAGKHVLCEKPCGTSATELRAMIAACQEHRVQFMDGVMFMHSNRLPLLRQVLDDGETIGAVRRIDSQFTFKAVGEFLQQNIRVSSDLEPLGCLGDLGWYNIRFSLWTMKEELPQRVTGRLLNQHGRGDSPNPVPTEFSGELLYAGGVSASFYCSFVTENQQWASISGDRGSLRLADFVLPFHGSESAFDVSRPVFRVTGCDFRMENHPKRFAIAEASEGMPESQETNMIRTFSRIVLNGKLEPLWWETSLKTQQVLDACLLSSREGGRAVGLS